MTSLAKVEIPKAGVLGAMETMYQRSKIQEESLHYETLKHTGEFPIIGVNTFLNSKGSPTIIPCSSSKVNYTHIVFFLLIIKPCSIVISKCIF